MIVKLKTLAMLLLLFSLSVGVQSETTGEKPIAGLLITNPPSDLSGKYSLSMNLVSTSDGSVCELVGSCPGVEPEKSSVRLAESDVREILSVIAPTEWMFSVDQTGNRTWLFEPEPGTVDDFTKWRYYFIVSFRDQGRIFYRTVAPHPEQQDQNLLASFLRSKPIREAAISLIRQAINSPAAKSIERETWEEVLDAEL